MTHITSPPGNTKFKTSDTITLTVVDGPITAIKVDGSVVTCSISSETVGGVTTYTVQVPPITSTGTRTITVEGNNKQSSVNVIIEAVDLPGDPEGPGPGPGAGS